MGSSVLTYLFLKSMNGVDKTNNLNLRHSYLLVQYSLLGLLFSMSLKSYYANTDFARRYNFWVLTSEDLLVFGVLLNDCATDRTLDQLMSTQNFN